MDTLVEQLSLLGIVPVVTIHDAGDAVPLAKALLDGGIPCAEVTFRTDAAQEAMKNITRAGLPILIGAGTVQNVEQVRQAVDCGAKFIVSPGLSPTVVE